MGFNVDGLALGSSQGWCQDALYTLNTDFEMHRIVPDVQYTPTVDH